MVKIKDICHLLGLQKLWLNDYSLRNEVHETMTALLVSCSI